MGFPPRVGSVGVAAAIRDEFAEPGAAQALRLAVFAGGLRIGQGGQKLQSATATIGVQPLRYVGHEAERAEPRDVRQGRVRCATEGVRFVDDRGVQSWTFTTAASPPW